MIPAECQYSNWVDPGLTGCSLNSSDQKWYRTLTGSLSSGSSEVCPPTNTRQELCTPVNATCAENEETNYTFGNTAAQGSTYRTEPFRYRRHIRDTSHNEYLTFGNVYRRREEFVLDPKIYTVSSSALSPTKWYRRGTLLPDKTPTVTLAQYGGTSCPSYPSPIYQYKIPTFDESAMCILTDSRVYKPAPSGMSGYVLKTPAELDAVDTSATGVTQRAAQFNGMKCSDRVAMEPLRFPARVSSLG